MSNNNVSVTCELQISLKCKKTYQLSRSNEDKIRNNNEGKLLCRYCSYELKYMGRNNPNCKYNLNDNFFNKIDTSEKAYLLGWIASDGHVGKFGFSITIHGEDIKCLKKMRNIICKEIPIIIFYDKKYKHNNVRLKINSQKISEDICNILQINPGNKSYVIKFPNIEKKFINDFIRGYFEGDGTLNNRKTSSKKIPIVGITSKSKFILKGLEQINIKYHNQSNRWINWSGKNAIQFLNAIYNNNFYILDRKYKLYIDWKNNFIIDGNLGENHYLSKLTEQNVVDIVNKNKLGMSQNKLSKEYGISRRTIQDILTGKTWKKITQK